jgi:lipopolysaccharide export system permease protein
VLNPRRDLRRIQSLIFQRALLKEFGNHAAAVFSALFAISLTSTLVRILGRAAGGKIPSEAVLATIGFTALNYLPVLLALTVFIAVLLTLSRSYRDSEMVVWFASGQSLLAFVRPVLFFAGPIAVLIAALSLFLAPWANERLEQYRQQLDGRDDASRIAPGVFLESPNADRVFFVESLSEDRGRVENVFVSFRQHERQGVMIARSGFVETRPNGDRFAVLENGRRYEGSPGTAEYRVMDFERYMIRIQAKELREERVSIKGRNTLELIAERSRDNLAELLWRIGLPIVALVLALLAIPLSFVNPRASTSINLLFAVFTYMVYTNMLSVAQAWVQQGRWSFQQGWWVVHALMLTVFALMLVRRVRLRILPRGADLRRAGKS